MRAGGVAVGGGYLGIIDTVVVEGAVGRLDLGPAAAGGREFQGGLLAQAIDEEATALVEALIAEIRRGQFFRHPRLHRRLRS